MEKGKLPEDIAGKYRMLAGHGVGEYHWNGHVVDLRTVSLEKAEYLVDNGFPYLVAKRPPKTLTA